MKLNKLLIAAASALTAQAAFAGVYPQCPFDITAASVTHETDAATGLTLHSRVASSATRPGRTGRCACTWWAATAGWCWATAHRPTASASRAGRRQRRAGDDQRHLERRWFPAPSITLRQDDEVWLSLTNVGMIHRPDLFDQHSVHWHGFPQASAIFDGVPQASATVQMGSTFTYYYKVNDPGTYLWHCHVEATEHMEMGMIGMLNVLPRQDNTSYTDASVGKAFTKFAYNDGDGSTGYDKAFSLQLGAVDSNFHELHELGSRCPSSS